MNTNGDIPKTGDPKKKTLRETIEALKTEAPLEYQVTLIASELLNTLERPKPKPQTNYSSKVDSAQSRSIIETGTTKAVTTMQAPGQLTTPAPALIPVAPIQPLTTRDQIMLPPIENTGTKLLVKLFNEDIKTSKEKLEKASKERIEALKPYRTAKEELEKAQDAFNASNQNPLDKERKKALMLAAQETLRLNTIELEKKEAAAISVKEEIKPFLQAAIDFHDAVQQSDLLGEGLKAEASDDILVAFEDESRDEILTRLAAEYGKKAAEFKALIQQTISLEKRLKDGPKKTEAEALITTNETFLTKANYIQDSLKFQLANLDLKKAEELDGDLSQAIPADIDSARKYDLKQAAVTAAKSKIEELKEKLQGYSTVPAAGVAAGGGASSRAARDPIGAEEAAKLITAARYLHNDVGIQLNDIKAANSLLAQSKELKDNAINAFLRTNARPVGEELAGKIDATTAGLTEETNRSRLGELLKRFDQISLGNESQTDNKSTILGKKVKDSTGNKLERETLYISGKKELNRNLLMGARITMSSDTYRKRCLENLKHIAKAFDLKPEDLYKDDPKEFAKSLLAEIKSLKLKDGNHEGLDAIYDNGRVKKEDLNDVENFLTRTANGFHRYLTLTPGGNRYEFQALGVNSTNNKTLYTRNGNGSVGIKDPSSITLEHARMLLAEVKIGPGIRGILPFGLGRKPIYSPISSTDKNFATQSLINIIKAFAELKKEKRMHNNEDYVLTIDGNLQQILSEKNKSKIITEQEKTDLKAAMQALQDADRISYDTISTFISSITLNNTPEEGANPPTPSAPRVGR